MVKTELQFQNVTHPIYFELHNINPTNTTHFNIGYNFQF